jgi:hypothetical protein
LHESVKQKVLPGTRSRLVRHCVVFADGHSGWLV